MIDFRYHLVSLISVFLALAVGIILGAGPLKESISDQLTGQVEQLRQEKDDLRTEADTLGQSNDRLQEYIAAVSNRTGHDVLADRRVAIIQVSDVSDGLYESIEGQLENSGAQITSRIQVSDSWVSPDLADSRQSYASSLTEFLPEDKRDVASDKAIASALIVALTEKSNTDPNTVSDNGALALEVLEGADLVQLVSYTSTPADAVVILDARSYEGEIPDQSAQSVLYANIAEAAAHQTEGVVVAGANVVENDLVSTIRENSSLVKLVATVSESDLSLGQLNTPLALAAALGNKVGHFGFEASATALVPAAVDLDAPDRSVSSDETADPDNAENEQEDGN
ncbi:copper transporter [Jonesia quinghaiensis]|uniref:copper transporter n=1 Tax=Jonesia quinghaiensis TaxID=262806 RepID=UPI000426DAB5|nr:copper transporter [Jonesia quinghaiensis]